jgi:hypothetical protein
MNLIEVAIKCVRLIVLMRHDSADIWGFRYRLTLVIGTLMNTASKLGPHTQTDRGTCPGVGL